MAILLCDGVICTFLTQHQMALDDKG